MNGPCGCAERGSKGAKGKKVEFVHGRKIGQVLQVVFLKGTPRREPDTYIYEKKEGIKILQVKYKKNI